MHRKYDKNCTFFRQRHKQSNQFLRFLCSVQIIAIETKRNEPYSSRIASTSQEHSEIMNFNTFALQFYDKALFTGDESKFLSIEFDWLIRVLYKSMNKLMMTITNGG